MKLILLLTFVSVFSMRNDVFAHDEKSLKIECKLVYGEKPFEGEFILKPSQHTEDSESHKLTYRVVIGNDRASAILDAQDDSIQLNLVRETCITSYSQFYGETVYCNTDGARAKTKVSKLDNSYDLGFPLVTYQGMYLYCIKKK